jgi:hypothetical protein
VLWSEVLLAFLVCHLVGDFVLQTEWQAINKRGGLGRSPDARRALTTHVATYTLAFVPAFVWAARTPVAALAMAVAVYVPHAVQDDGRLLQRWNRDVKKMDPVANWVVAMLVDQSFHVVALFALAVAVATA